MKKRMVLLVTATAAVTSSCSNEFDGACTPNMVFGLQIHVENAQSEAPICDAVVTAREGAYLETLVPSVSYNAGCYYFGASERAGTYSLRAEAAGFSPNVLANVRVRVPGGDCHVETVRTSIRLVPTEQR